MLQQTDYPLLEQVMQGPMEEEAKIFIKEKRTVQTISEEVWECYSDIDYFKCNNMLFVLFCDWTISFDCCNMEKPIVVAMYCL